MTTTYFLRLKDWIRKTIDEERNILYGPLGTVTGLYMALGEVTKLEAEFECQSLQEAGYF